MADFVEVKIEEGIHCEREIESREVKREFGGVDGVMFCFPSKCID